MSPHVYFSGQAGDRLAAIKHHKIGCFYLRAANNISWEKARLFLQSYEKMLVAAQGTPKPFLFEVQGSGVLKRRDLP